jgi:hypothetical protein
LQVFASSPPGFCHPCEGHSGKEEGVEQKDGSRFIGEKEAADVVIKGMPAGRGITEGVV